MTWVDYKERKPEKHGDYRILIYEETGKPDFFSQQSSSRFNEVTCDFCRCYSFCEDKNSEDEDKVTYKKTSRFSAFDEENIAYWLEEPPHPSITEYEKKYSLGGYK